MWIRLKSVKKGLTVKHQGSFCGKQNETLPEKRKHEVGGENCSLKYPWGWGGVSCTLHSHVLICQLYSCDFEWTLWASSSLKGLLLFSFFFLTSKLLRRLLLSLDSYWLCPYFEIALYSASCSLVFPTPQVPCGAQQIWKSSSVRWEPRAMFPWISTIITFLNLTPFAFKSVLYTLHV